MKYPYLVAGTLPDLVSTDPVRIYTQYAGEALIAAEGLKALGYTVEVRTWSRRQHRKQGANGRWYWRAGFVPYTI